MYWLSDFLLSLRLRSPFGHVGLIIHKTMSQKVASYIFVSFEQKSTNLVSFKKAVLVKSLREMTFYSRADASSEELSSH